MRKQKLIYPFAAGFLAVIQYLWGVWYYGGLYRSDAILSSAAVTSESLFATLMQHILAILPLWAALIVCLVVMRREMLSAFGFVCPTRGKRMITAFAAVIYLLLLIAALFQRPDHHISILYQWIYYLLLVAFAEEAVFRGLMPWLMQKGKLPEWCVWVIPGILFGLMHTMMPLIKDGFGTVFFQTLLSGVGGLTLGACGFYLLRRWSGSLWLPVLVHAALDFLGAVF